MLQPGLYEQVINKLIAEELSKISKNQQDVEKIDSAEASRILSKYVGEVVQKAMENVLDHGGNIDTQLDITNQIISLLREKTDDVDFSSLLVEENAEQLLAILKDKDSSLATGRTAADVIRPETSIAQSSLFTGAVHEPQMESELKKEIVTADRIDMLVSFIKWSGLRQLINELRIFTTNGGQLRVITTSYMGATDVKAIEELNQLPNTQIKISYDTKRTRLHAKSYVFYRNTGFTTAYVGSSNMSNAALTSGLEWNLKITKKDLPETIDKIEATFESYWNSTDFEIYSNDKKEKLAKSLKAEKNVGTTSEQLYTINVRPYSYQQEILDKLEAERTIRNNYRNLVVAATGD